MKRALSLTLTLILLLALLIPCAGAVNALTLIYDLTVDVSETVNVKPGDVITVSFRIRRPDAGAENFMVSILQNEIIYDQNFFEYVPDSAKAVKNGANALFQTRTDGTHIIKASFFNPNGGTFVPGEVFCTFQLRVIGTAGAGYICCDWSCAKAYDSKNAACSVIDSDNDPAAEVWLYANGFCHTFTDVKNDDWFHSAVDYVSQNSLMNGVGNNLFSPNSTMTRAMLVTVLYRLSGSPAVSGRNPFSDVHNGQWYTDAVIWANANSIVVGYGNGKFGTNDSVTREQIATIMCRYAKQRGVDVTKTTSLANYTDEWMVSSWAKDAVRWANAIGLMIGRTTTTLAPQDSASRAEVATILMRLCENVL